MPPALDPGALHRARAEAALSVGRRYAIATREARAALARDPHDVDATLTLAYALDGDDEGDDDVGTDVRANEHPRHGSRLRASIPCPMTRAAT